MPMPTPSAKRKKLTADELQAATDAFVAYLRRGSGFGAAVQYLRKAADQLTVEPAQRDYLIDGDCEFASAIVQGGGLVATCDFCGRTYFATWNTDNYDDPDDDEPNGKGELERLRELARDPKNKYIEWGDVESITHGMLDGREYVYGCDCKAAQAYENFVWNHRYSIADFLKKRAAEARAEAEVTERLAAAANTVNE